MVPTDFSTPANNAVYYAVELAQNINAAVTLYHCFHVPVFATPMPEVTVDFEDKERESLQLLDNLKKKLNKEYPAVNINLVANAGFAVDEIVQYSKSNHVDLIVMGISGSGVITELMGDTTTAVAKDANVPVLIIPLEAQFSGLKNIVIAFDRKKITDKGDFDVIVNLANKFDSTVTALHVRHYYETPNPEESLSEMQINEMLDSINFKKINFITDVDTAEGLEHYQSKHDVDLLVMTKRKHSFLDLLFNGGSVTKKMAFHTHRPLLILHE